MYASGLGHKIFMGKKSLLSTSISLAGNGLDFNEQRLDEDLEQHPRSNARKDHFKITLQSTLTNYVSDKHINRTGFFYSHLGYDLEIKQASSIGSSPKVLTVGKGQTDLFQFYTASKMDLTKKLELNGGIHMSYFPLNTELSLEPRAALKYHINTNQSVALAYGRHSRIEDLPIYFVNSANTMPNKELKMMKADHMVLSYNTLLGKHFKLTIEPYYQYLQNVPVNPNSYVSTLNIQNSLFFDKLLVSKGTARNLGIDITLERFLHNGMYYLFTSSIYDSKYTAADGIKRNARFNKNYVFNALFGKEWQVGKDKNNLFSANIRMNYLGGNRKESIDEQSSKMTQDVVYAETSGRLSFSDQFPALPIFSFTLSYRRNKRDRSSVWALQVLNASQTPDFETHIFNSKSQTVEEKFSNIMIPNLSYKVDF